MQKRGHAEIKKDPAEHQKGPKNKRRVQSGLFVIPRKVKEK